MQQILFHLFLSSKRGDDDNNADDDDTAEQVMPANQFNRLIGDNFENNGFLKLFAVEWVDFLKPHFPAFITSTGSAFNLESGSKAASIH